MKRVLMTLVAAATLIAGANLHAGVIASSKTTISGLTLKSGGIAVKSDGEPLIASPPGFSFLNSATVNGANATTAGFFPSDALPTPNPAPVLVGPGPVVDNAFTQVAADSASSDSNVFGTVVDYGLAINPPNPVGATGTTYADLALDTDGSASALSSLTNAGTLSLTAPFAGTLEFTAALDMKVMNDGAVAGLGVANSSFRLQLTGTSDAAAGFSFDSNTDLPALSPFTQTIVLGGAGTAVDSVIAATFFSIPLGTLDAGTYGFTISQTNDVSFTQVPEPGTLATFAVVGVCGLVGIRRRRRNK